MFSISDKESQSMEYLLWVKNPSELPRSVPIKTIISSVLKGSQNQAKPSQSLLQDLKLANTKIVFHNSYVKYSYFLILEL